MATSLQAQEQQADSLIKLLENPKLSLKEQANIYFDLYELYVPVDHEKAYTYAEQGLAVSEKANDKTLIANFLLAYGRIYTTRSEYDTAISYLEKSLDLAIAIESKALQAGAYLNIGNAHGRQEEHLIALDYFMKALALFEETGNKLRCTVVMMNIASTYRTIENNERAIYYLEKVLQIADELNSDFMKMAAYSDLAIAYYNQDKNDMALEYAHKAYQLNNTYPDLSRRSVIVETLATIYSSHVKDYDKAMEYAQESISIAERLGDTKFILGAWNVISNIYREQERYEESEEAALKALAIDSTTLHPGINIAQNILVSNIMLGKKEKAFDALKNFILFINQHIDESDRRSLADLELKYETEKKELRITALEKERQLYIWMGVLGFIIAIFFGLVLFQQRRNARKERQLIATRSVLDGEMGERTRIARDLHDRLSGNLSAVRIGLNSEVESLQAVCDKLDSCIEEVRRVAHNLMPSSLRFGLKVALEDYAAQFPNVHFHFFGKETPLEERTAFVLYCCANELVNNSIRHAKATTINMQLIQNEKHVSLTVQDDGCGFNEKHTASGIGLKNIRDRVTSCNGNIDIATAPGKGTETTIEIKIKNH
jgi:signal transduction histidine kinase